MDGWSFAMGESLGVEVVVVGGENVLEGHHIEAHMGCDPVEHRMDWVVQARSVHAVLV